MRVLLLLNIVWLALLAFTVWSAVHSSRLRRAVAEGRSPPRYPVTLQLPSNNLIPFFVLSLAWIGAVVTFLFGTATALEALEPWLPQLVALFERDGVVIAVLVGWLLLWGAALLWGIPRIHEATAPGHLEIDDAGIKIVLRGTRRFDLDWAQPWRLEQLFLRKIIVDDEGTDEIFYPAYSLSQGGQTVRLIFGLVPKPGREWREVPAEGPGRYFLRVEHLDRRVGGQLRRRARERNRSEQEGGAGLAS
jgi:hypothetical protein